MHGGFGMDLQAGVRTWRLIEHSEKAGFNRSKKKTGKFKHAVGDLQN